MVQVELQCDAAPYDFGLADHSAWSNVWTSFGAPPIGLRKMIGQGLGYPMIPSFPLQGWPKVARVGISVFCCSSYRLLDVLPLLQNSLCSQLLIRYVGLIISDATNWAFSIWRAWFAMLAIGSRNIFSSFTWATTFLQISSYLSYNLDSGGMTTKPRSFAWIRNVDRCRGPDQRGKGVLFLMLSLCGIPLLLCCYSCCAWRPLRRTCFVAPSSNWTTL